MFDHRDAGVGLSPGEGSEVDVLFQVEDDLSHEIACRLVADGWDPEEQHSLPSGLEGMVPDVFVAAVVSSVDPHRLNGHDAVRLMQTRARLVSHHEAGRYEAMAEVAFSPPGDSDSPVERDPVEIDYVAAEIAAGLTLTRRASETELDRAVSLTGRLKRVWCAFSKGHMSLAKVRVFDQQLGHLPEETVGIVLDEVLVEASDLTAGQLRARLSRLILEADPDGSASSFEEGLADRKVVAYPNPDLTASLAVYSGRPDEVAAARNHIEDLARSVKTRDETRTLDQIRADVALDLLRGECHHRQHTMSSSGGRANVTISAETLLGLSDRPGDLDGYGPVVAEIARKTVFDNVDGEWVFTVTDNGRPVSTGTLARRPTRAQSRQVAANYPKCTAPGCRQDAWDCDIDHRQPYSRGGTTCVHNLAPLCRYHHQAKDEGGWKLKRLPNGDHQWTSPLGHTYLTKRGPPD